VHYLTAAIIFISVIVSFTGCNNSDDLSDLYPDSTAVIKYQLDWQRNFYKKKIKEYKDNPIGKNKIVFLGNSITYSMRHWDKKFNVKNIVNRGISGDYSDGILERLDEIIYYKPLAVFLLIGLNDFFDDNTTRPGRTPEYVAKNILTAAKTIKQESPETKIFIQTILPINNQQYLDEKPQVNFLWTNYYPSVNQQVNETNKILKENNEFEIIDLHPLYLNNDRSMKRNLSKDGVHLNENGYNIWIDRVKPLIDRVNAAAN
jgi:lysophospholipase L1-like esterase